LITLGSDTNCWDQPSALLPINRRLFCRMLGAGSIPVKIDDTQLNS
jgi:hypothetical protein